jgi:SHS2 domain-containing protein
MAFKFLEHTADLKVRVSEKTIEGAFLSSALALKEAIAERVKVKSKLKKQIEINGRDLNSLLYNFLEEFLFLLDAEGFLLSEIKNFKLDKKKLKIKCLLFGDKAGNYKFTNDVKAITYNDMKITNSKGKSVIEFVVDV